MQQDAYDFVDLTATWSDVMSSKLELSAYVKNATDERYVGGSISQYGGIGFDTQVYSDPCTHGARLRYRF